MFEFICVHSVYEIYFKFIYFEMDPIWDYEDPILWGEDEGDEERNVRRDYKMRRRVQVEDFDDVDFFVRFRMKKESVFRVLELIEHKLTYGEER